MGRSGSIRRLRRRTIEKPRGWGRFWIGLAAFVFYPLTLLLARTRVDRLEGIPAEGPAILVLNHVSHLDPAFDAVTVHRSGRVPRFLAKNTLWSVPVLGSVLAGSGQIPVFRGTTDARKSVEEAHNALAEGKVILIYPDGTITKDPDGWPMLPKVGVARLALDCGVPVIPIARWGTRSILDAYAKKFRPVPRKDVRYKVGEPVDLSEFAGKDADTRVLRDVAHRIMGEVRDLLGEIRGERPPEKFYVAPAKPAKGSLGDG